MAITKLKLLPRSTMKAKSATFLAGQIEAGDGIAVTKANGIWTIAVDIPGLGLSNYQPIDADLTALAALSGTGLARRTASNTWSVGSSVALASEVSGTLPLANGGTSGTTALTAQSGLGLRAHRTATTTYYVRTSTAANPGSDSNTGLTNDAAGAFLTIQAAVNAWIRNTDARGQTSQIQVTGNSTENVVIAGIAPGVLGALAILGDTTTPANCTVTPASGICFEVKGGAQVSISGFKVAPPSAGAGFSCTFHSQLYIGTTDYAAIAGGGGCISASDFGNIWLLGTHKLTGNVGYFIHQPGPSQVYGLAPTINIPSAIAFSTYFVGIASLANCYLGNASFTGAGYASCTGRRGTTHYSSVLDHGGQATNFLPGDLDVQAIEDGTWKHTTRTVSGFDILQANTINGVTINSTTGTLNIANGKTFDVQNTMQFASNDSITVVFGAGGTVAYVTEGTFTPTVTFGGASTGITYGVQVGRYQKVGTRVHVQVRIVLTSKGSATGAAKIAGLPFSTSNASNNFATFSCYVSSVNTTAFWMIGGDNGATTMFIQYLSGGNATPAADTDFTNTTTIWATGVYEST